MATVFPGFAAALRDGEVTDTHCSIMVEKTRVVADETVLAEIERRVLPKAKRLTPGEFAGEVAKTIARLDRDAAARVKKARATHRGWARQLDDGMGYLGLTHDWSTIQAIHDAVAIDGRCRRWREAAQAPWRRETRAPQRTRAARMRGRRGSSTR